jgi:chitodextrinase
VTSDVQPPTDPSALSAIAISNSQVNLNWTGSTDNVGVSNYLVERCQNDGCSNFAQVAATTNTTLTDAGLAASTSYSYRVRARDAAANLSGYSNIVSATTLNVVTPPSTPTFKQQASSVPQSTSVISLTATYAAIQSAGDLNVVIVGWNDNSAAIINVTDSAGNVYTRAIGPTLGAGLSQSMYYAKNILGSAAGTNRVTVTFSPAARYPDLRILEYSGMDTSAAIDVTSGAVGNSSTSSSGLAITTNPTDLLVGANIVATLTNAPGAGFTSRVITNPNGDIAEDQNVSVTGSYAAIAPLSGAGPWVMQLVAFRAAGSPAAALQRIEGGRAER